MLGINNRGSSGYGKTFNTADDHKHGREPLWDCVAAKKYLQSLPYVDADRIGIIGGSYGGYMVLAALAFQPEQFAVGVDIFGVSNWLRTLESIPKWWEAQRVALYKEIGDPEKDAEFLQGDLAALPRRQDPPAAHRRPGRQRPARHPAASPTTSWPPSRRTACPVEYVVFPDEGHGFTKKKNQIEGWSAILKFLDQYLKVGRVGSALKE